MKQLIGLSLLVIALGWVPLALAGNPQMQRCSQDIVGNTLTVEGKLVGLGNETQVHIEVTATAECINRGNHNPNAANKTSVTAEGTFPAQNGKALFSLDLEAVFSPECSPPMTVEFTDVEACDTTHGICCTL